MRHKDQKAIKSSFIYFFLTCIEDELLNDIFKKKVAKQAW